MRRETRIEGFLQTTESFSHDTADIEDRRAGHLFVRQAVCRVPNVDPNDHDPLHFPPHHKSPERRAMRQAPPRDRHPGPRHHHPLASPHRGSSAVVGADARVGRL